MSELRGGEPSRQSVLNSAVEKALALGEIESAVRLRDRAQDFAEWLVQLGRRSEAVELLDEEEATLVPIGAQLELDRARSIREKVEPLPAPLEAAPQS